MARLLFTLLLGLLAAPAFAAPIPVFDDPKALLEAIYAQIEAGENWETFDQDAAFETLDAFSSGLHAAYLEGDADIKASGNEMGILDFSPFINGQDSAGMDFAVGEPEIKDDRAFVTVAITGYEPQEIEFELVHEGSSGWKIDDILLQDYPGDPLLRLSQYFADRRDTY